MSEKSTAINGILLAYGWGLQIDSIIRHSTHPFERAAADKRLTKLDSFVNELAITGV